MIFSSKKPVRSLIGDHRPRKRAIQYAVKLAMKDGLRGVLDAPPSRGMTS